MLAGLIFFLMMFAFANLFYFVFSKASNILERFAACFVGALGIAFIVSLATDFDMLKINLIKFSGYYLLLYLVHLFIIEVIKLNKYSIYVISFSAMAFFVTIFYDTVIQSFIQYF
ncbi:hypothetical protein CLV73_0972 [Chryseobacterium geocarposphaerae]|uniref:Uncharacterized protein n=1 Tax=Chryseobacterium geocarposphaerae TaxID=1416776 RepID=A0A2M9C810_9FLAO|nr:hypothetical protein CLV73_0972 [Chryseobacterium geocarposphaerae]